MNQPKTASILNIAVICSCIGVFCGYIWSAAFHNREKESMFSVGATMESMLVDSTKVINWQMVGLLLGGVALGYYGDKKDDCLFCLARSFYIPLPISLPVLFILLMNSAYCRFACRPGAGSRWIRSRYYTEWVSLLPKNKETSVHRWSPRYCIGLGGAVAAYFTYQLTNDWRLCYKIQGCTRRIAFDIADQRGRIQHV